MQAASLQLKYAGIRAVGLSGAENEDALFLVRRNLQGLVDSVLLECQEFQTTSVSKLTALKQLLHLVVLADWEVAPYCERIYLTLGGILFSFDEKEFVDAVEDVSAALGLASGAAITVPVLLKLIGLEAAKNSNKALANYLKLAISAFASASVESLAPSVPQILATLGRLEQSFLDHYELAVFGAKLIEVLVAGVGVGLSSHCSQLFGVFLTIQSTVHQRDGMHTLDALTEAVAKASGYADAAEMYASEVQELMERYFLSKEYAEWSRLSKERFKFEVVVRRCREGLPKYLEVVLDVLARCTEPDKDPELRFDMLLLLEFVLDTNNIEAAVRANSAEIVKKVLVQALLWRSGKPSIKTRKAAVLIFSKLLAKALIAPPALHKQYPEVVAALKNNLEDDWAADLRLASTHFLRQLIETLRPALDQFELSSLYPLLLARMDDAQDPIRVQTCEALKAFFACPNLRMSDSTFEYVCQTLFIHLDDKNEDVQAAVFKTLEFAGSIRPNIVYAEACKSKSKQKFPRLCEKLIELLQAAAATTSEAGSTS